MNKTRPECIELDVGIQDDSIQVEYMKYLHLFCTKCLMSIIMTVRYYATKQGMFYLNLTFQP